VLYPHLRLWHNKGEKVKEEQSYQKKNKREEGKQGKRRCIEILPITTPPSY